MKILAIALLALACLGQEKFKETEKTKGSAGAPPSIKIPENLRMKVTLTESFNFAIGLDLAANSGMMKINLYSDLGDFEHFNLLDFGNKMIYIRIGKLCRHVPLPEGFTFPMAQILGMWSLFAKYEGMDETKEHYKYLAPTVVDKRYQAHLYFGESDKKLKKIVYGDMTFAVETFETFTEPNEVFQVPENCGPLKTEELQGLGRLMSGLVSGFQKSMNKGGF